jgi:hypothetical protein
MWQKRQGEATPVRNFYLRRLLRIAPLFWLAIAVYFALSKRSLAASWTQLLLSSSFLHGFFPQAINAIVPGGWSIRRGNGLLCVLSPVDYQVQQTPPALPAARHRDLDSLYVCSQIVASVSAQQLSSSALGHSPAANREFLYLIFPNQAPVFLLGCYHYHRLAACQFPSRFEQLLLGCWLAFSLAAGLISGEGPPRFCGGVSGPGGCGASNRAGQGPAGAAASPRPPVLRHLSEPFLDPCRGCAERLPCNRGLDCLAVAMILTTSLSYGVALLINRLIEAPINRFTRQLTGPNPS